MNNNAVEFNRKKLYNRTMKLANQLGRDLDPEIVRGFRNYCLRDDDAGIMNHEYKEFQEWLKIWDMADNREVVFDIEIVGDGGYIEAYDHRGNIKHIFEF